MTTPPGSRSLASRQHSNEIVTTAPHTSLLRAPSSWMGVNWPLQSWPTVRRGHSDGHMVPRDAATSTSCEAVVSSGRQSAVKRKRVIDVGQKTVKQMNELARYVNTKGPCAVCKTPGTVVTLTQIKRRRRKFMRYWSKHAGTEATKGTPEAWSPGPSTPVLGPSGARTHKSVSWTEHREMPREVGPDMLNNETGAFLLLVSIVALIVGILVIVKATENSVKEYLGLVAPAASLDTALRRTSEELAIDAAEVAADDDLDEEDELRENVPAPVRTTSVQEMAARQIQRWYRRCQSASRDDHDPSRRKRIDRWAQTLRAFFSRRKSNFRAGIQKRWMKKRGDGPAGSDAATEGSPPTIQAVPSSDVRYTPREASRERPASTAEEHKFLDTEPTTSAGWMLRCPAPSVEQVNEERPSGRVLHRSKSAQ